MRQLAILLVTIVSACDEDRPPPPPTGIDAGTPACDGVGAVTVCIDDAAFECDGAGNIVTSEDCGATGQVCAPLIGCRSCIPNTVRCDGETVVLCNADGTGTTTGETCDTAAGLHCSPLGCTDLCADARDARSYIGCEYWPTVTRNSELAPEFEFAVVIANPQLVPADVTIDRAGTAVSTVTVAPGALETVRLPWVDELRLSPGSALVRGGAYRLRSNVPVTVYQFNPLDYRRSGDCAVEPAGMDGDGQCFAFTNDASLLLPTTVLTGSYIAVTRPSHDVRIDTDRGVSPGFVTIVGVGPSAVDVEVTARGRVIASDDGAVSAMAPGDTQTLSLAAGDVLQLLGAPNPADCDGELRSEDIGDATIGYCLPGLDYDLTGTEIRASGPVAVIAGHNCTFVPFDRWACDHLEEAMFPTEAWGREIVVSATQPIRSEPNLVRVVSGQDGNTISFTPSISTPVTLDRGQFVELESDSDLVVTGTDPLLVAQFLVGQDFFGFGASGPVGEGDPSMALGIPSEQFRSSYAFLAPESFDRNFVNVTAPTGSRVVLDGRLVTGFREVEGTVFSTRRIPIAGGAHTLEGSAPFGIVVYGFGSYTSYLVPGGLDLRQIAPPI